MNRVVEAEYLFLSPASDGSVMEVWVRNVPYKEFDADIAGTTIHFRYAGFDHVINTEFLSVFTGSVKSDRQRPLQEESQGLCPKVCLGASLRRLPAMT